MHKHARMCPNNHPSDIPARSIPATSQRIPAYPSVSQRHPSQRHPSHPSDIPAIPAIPALVRYAGAWGPLPRHASRQQDDAISPPIAALLLPPTATAHATSPLIIYPADLTLCRDTNDGPRRRTDTDDTSRSSLAEPTIDAPRSPAGRLQHAMFAVGWLLCSAPAAARNQCCCPSQQQQRSSAAVGQQRQNSLTAAHTASCCLRQLLHLRSRTTDPRAAHTQTRSAHHATRHPPCTQRGRPLKLLARRQSAHSL
jgi:hypothetical protein